MRFSEKAFQRRVALALAHLCSADDQRKIFIDHNGLELLIGLLGSSCPKAATRQCRGKPQISLEFLVHPEVAYKVYGVKPPESAVLNGRKSVGEQIYTSYYSPIGARVKCLSYAGYFINARDVSGTQHIKQFFSQIVTKHGSAGNLPISCTSRLSPRLCFFPQYVVSQITTPIFFVNATYDSWQIKNILAPGVADPHGH